mmetsp:Transcript_24248/g.34958  ORF Transcript_24248/g.34958 Transcript_24248/m.34958 type:complete len:201 (+) Transcript_24248:74-676(+)
MRLSSRRAQVASCSLNEKSVTTSYCLLFEGGIGMGPDILIFTSKSSIVHFVNSEDVSQRITELTIIALEYGLLGIAAGAGLSPRALSVLSGRNPLGDCCLKHPYEFFPEIWLVKPRSVSSGESSVVATLRLRLSSQRLRRVHCQACSGFRSCAFAVRPAYHPHRLFSSSRHRLRPLCSRLTPGVSSAAALLSRSYKLRTQ